MLTRGERRPRVSEWDDFWYERQGYENSTGIDVNEDNSLTYFAVWACRKVISEDLGGLPLHIYSANGNMREKAISHPLYSKLHDAPNIEMSAMPFREALQDHLLSFGNCYAQIERNLRGDVMSLWPLDPARMEVTRPEKELVYKYVIPGREPTYFPREEIFHIGGLGYNGLIGYSPIKYHANSVGLGLSEEKYKAKNYKNGGRLQLVFTHPAPKAPGKDGREEFKKAMREEFGGREGNTIGVLWEGMKAEPISMTMEDAQIIEASKLTWLQICSIYRVQPHKVMNLFHATFSNIENQDIDYAKSTILPWAVRWEQNINRQLLGLKSGYYAKHNIEGLMRGDILSRYQAYAIGRQWGWLTVNQIMEKEDMNPVDGGDTRLEPLNMVSIDENGEKDQLQISAGKPPEAPITDAEKEAAARAIRQLRLIWR
jgi:HK97 family phage portal protein